MNVLRVDATAANAPQQFAESLKNTGFAVLTNHGISKQLIEDTYQEWQNFFSSDNKNSFHFNRETQDGYFPQTISEKAVGAPAKDIKEFFQYYPWGQFPQAMSSKTQKLYNELQKLAATLLDWIQASLPKSIESTLSMPLSKMIENTHKTMLRILHYPPLSGNEPEHAVRAAAHGDINLITLLVGATASGLQVLDSDNQWHDVPTDKESIAVNIGDMLEMCCQGYFCSTTHRVINPDCTNESRLSMPLFLHPRSDVLLKENFTADQYLKERLVELGVY